MSRIRHSTSSRSLPLARAHLGVVALLALGLAAPAQADTGEVDVLLGKFREAQSALDYQKRLAREEAHALAKRSPSIVLHEAGGGKLEFHLLVQSFKNEVEATAFCDSFSSGMPLCVPVSHQGEAPSASTTAGGTVLPMREASAAERQDLEAELKAQMAVVAPEPQEGISQRGKALQEVDQARSSRGGQSGTRVARTNFSTAQDKANAEGGDERAVDRLVPIEMAIPGKRMAERHEGEVATSPPSGGSGVLAAHSHSADVSQGSTGTQSDGRSSQFSEALDVMLEMNLPVHAPIVARVGDAQGAFDWLGAFSAAPPSGLESTIVVTHDEAGFNVATFGFKDRVAAAGICGVFLRADISCTYDSQDARLRFEPVESYREAVEMAGVLARFAGERARVFLAYAEEGRSRPDVRIAALGMANREEARELCLLLEAETGKSCVAPVFSSSPENGKVPELQIETGSGPWHVQLSSFSGSKSVAREELGRQNWINRQALGGLRADLVPSQTRQGYWRVVVGGFSKDQAQNLCDRITSIGNQCILRKGA